VLDIQPFESDHAGGVFPCVGNVLWIGCAALERPQAGSSIPRGLVGRDQIKLPWSAPFPQMVMVGLSQIRIGAADCGNRMGKALDGWALDWCSLGYAAFKLLNLARKAAIFVFF